MRKQILFILSTLALLMHPLSLSAQNSTAGDHVLTPDFDGDGQVGFPDFLAFVSQFGAREGDGRYDAKYDLNRDGEIGFSDFLIFSSNFDKSGDEAALIVIPDANLRAIVEDILGQSSGEPIARSKMARLMRIEARNANIRDLTGLEFAPRLTFLDFGDEIVEGQSVNSNSISDLTPLSGLTDLTYLYLDDNDISDITPLSDLTSLEVLRLSSNDISDITPLSGLTSLRSLYLSSNDITDITPLSRLTRLNRLILFINSISDLSPLVANTGLGTGDLVDVERNPLSAMSYRTHIPALEDRGVIVLVGALKPAVEKIEIPGEMMEPFKSEEWKRKDVISSK